MVSYLNNSFTLPILLPISLTYFTLPNLFYLFFTLRHESTGLVSSGASLTSWGEGTSLALVGHPSSDSVTIKMLYGVDVLHQPASHPIFSYWVG